MTRRRSEASPSPDRAVPDRAAPDATRPDRAARDRTLLWVIVVWIPLAITALGTAVLVAWAPRLPAEVVTKWDAAGQPTQAMTPAGVVLAYAGISLGLIVIFAIGAFAGGGAAAAAAGARRDGEASEPQRPLALARPIAVFAPATTVLLAIMMLGLTGTQLDGATATDGWTVAGIVLSAAIVSAGVGVVTWHALPAPRRTRAPRATPAIELAPGERAAWTATVHAPWPVVALVGLALVLSLLPVVLAPASWPLTLLLVLVIGLLATTIAARITVDRRGLRVATLLGMPLARVPLDQVVSAADVEISPASFGGWGFRFDASGRRGVILRSGSALEVEREGKAPFVVTVPDAETGAALLNGFVARR